MEYEIRISSAAVGVIPMIKIVEAMARHATRAYGLPLHEPTLQEFRRQRLALLMDAANEGRLKVCDGEGRVKSAQALRDALPMPVALEWPPPYSSDILSLNVKDQHLIEWGVVNGDSFRVVRVPGEVVVFDRTNEDGAVIEAGAYRGVVDFGDSSVAPLSSTQPGDVEIAVPSWQLKKSESDNFRGYIAALRKSLQVALDKGKARPPRPADIVDEWARKPVHPVTSVDDGLVSYENGNGQVVQISKTRKGTLDALRKSISRHTEKPDTTGR